MNFPSVTPGMEWEVSLYKMRKPARMVATECKIELMNGMQMSTVEWNARRVDVALTGRATDKAIQLAYTELVNTMHNKQLITQETLNANPQFKG